jgi:hypothetical protein
MANLAARDATKEIIRLINSRPTSPWPAEIEAIIARAAAPNSGRTFALGNISPDLAAAFAEWETVRDHYDAAGELYGHTDDPSHKVDADHWSQVFHEKSEAVLELGARSLADLQLLLPVVLYWNSPISLKSPPYPHCTLEVGGADEGEYFEAKSTAYLVRALIDLLGRLICTDGGPNLSTGNAEFPIFQGKG